MKSKSAFRLVRTGSRAAYLLAAATAALLVAHSAQAADITWDPPTGGNWNISEANWAGDSTTFADDGTVNVTFDKTNGGTITIDPDMSPLSTTVSAASGTYIFSGGPIDSGTLLKSGNGLLSLSSPNSFSGVTLNSGTVYLGNNNAIGSNTLTINGGEVSVMAWFTFPNNPIIINNSCTFRCPNATGIGFGNGDISLGNNATVTLILGQSPNLTNAINNNGYNLTLINQQDGGTTISGKITGAGGLSLRNDLTGNGKTLIVNNATSDFTGPTTLQSSAAANLAIVTPNLSLAGVAGSLGMPAAGADAVIQVNNGVVWRPGGTTDRSVNLVSEGTGTVTLTVDSSSGNANLNGPITATGTGAKTLYVNMPWNNWVGLAINGAISDGSDGSPLTLRFNPGYNGGGDGNGAFFYLQGLNTFSGPINMEGTGSKFQVYPEMCALNISGSGCLGYDVGTGTGNYTNTINLSATPWATFNYSSSADQALSGDISGAGRLVKSGAGTLTLSGSNSYAGATAISNGILKLQGGSLANTAIAVTGSGTLAVQPASTTAISAGNTATAAAGATLNLGGRIFDMTDGFVSTFNLVQEDTFAGNALTIVTGATLMFNLGTAGTDLLAVTKAAAVSGTVNVTIDTSGAGSLPPGTYNLITAASGLDGGTWQFTDGGTSQEVTIGANTYDLTLNASATAVSVTVSGSGSGSAYDSWASGLANPAFDFDSDNNGIPNGLQWILGGTQTQRELASIAPGLTHDATYFQLTFKRVDASVTETTLSTEWDVDLTGTWTSVAVDQTVAGSYNYANGVIVTVVTNAAAPDDITVKIPRSNAVGGKLFARLKATRP